MLGAGNGGVIHLAGRMVTTEDLLIDLGSYLGAGVLQAEDKSGLTGNYDLKLEFVDPRGRGTNAAADGAPIDLIGEPAPDVFEALEKQLGLKLERIKVLADVIVIDHLDKFPTENRSKLDLRFVDDSLSKRLAKLGRTHRTFFGNFLVLRHDVWWPCRDSRSETG